MLRVRWVCCCPFDDTVGEKSGTLNKAVHEDGVLVYKGMVNFEKNTVDGTDDGMFDVLGEFLTAAGLAEMSGECTEMVVVRQGSVVVDWLIVCRRVGQFLIGGEVPTGVGAPQDRFPGTFFCFDSHSHGEERFSLVGGSSRSKYDGT